MIKRSYLLIEAVPGLGTMWAILCICFAAPLLCSAATPPPSNDSCTNAEVIPPNPGFPYWTSIQNISNATTNGDPAKPDCIFSGNYPNLLRSVWYTFTPAIPHNYTISSCANAPTATTVSDTAMGIYTAVGGCAGTMMQIAEGCADDSCGAGFLQASITAPLQAGVQYFIVVWRYGTDVPSADNSLLQLRVDLAFVPSNDTCEGALPLTLNQPVSGTTVLAANDYEIAPSCLTGNGQTASTAGGRDVVYSFTAPETNDYSFRLSNFNTANDDDPVLYVIDACPVGPKPITITNCLAAANRTVFGSAEEIFCLHLDAGQQVFVVVDDDNPDPQISASSSFTLEVSICQRESEPNNGTANANVILCGLEGAISPANDVDMFYLGVPKTGWRLFAMVDGGAAGPTSDLTMRVITPNGTLEWDGANNDRLFGDLASNVAGTPLTNLPTYLRINRPSLPSGTEPYRLFAVTQPPLTNATVETEPNNLLSDANRASNNYFFGALSSSTDVDSFQFDAEAGDVVFVSLAGDPRRTNSQFNATLELLDEAGNVLVIVDDDSTSFSDNRVNTSTNSNNYPFSPGEALVCRVANSATYFARVSVSPSATGAAASGGEYLLSITRNCVPGSGEPEQPKFQSITILPNGHYELTGLGIPGVTYRFESTSTIDPPSWKPIAESARVANGDGTFQLEDPTDPMPSTQRFYRITWP